MLHSRTMADPAARNRPISLAGLGLLALLALFWGVNWPVMKIAVADIPLLTFRSFCVVAGAVGLLGLARIRGEPLAVPRALWPRVGWAALTNIGLWNLMVVLGVWLLPAGRASILGYTMAVWATVLGWIFLGERVSAKRGLGVGLGIAAMAILIGDDLRMLGTAPWGALAMLTGAVSWAIGVVLMRAMPPDVPTTAITGWQMVLVTPFFILGALVVEHDQWRMPGWPAILATLYNMLISFNFCYLVWNAVVRMVPVAVSGVGSLAIPVVAVLSSMALLGERPGPEELAALLLVMLAIAAVAWPERRV
jgi:drug/metabolite transporter (DMT)-like permease